jgi:protein TonB
MRRAYHAEKSPAGLALSVFFSVGLTAVLFGVLPFAHRIAQPERGLELRKTTATDLPPPVVEPDAAPEPDALTPPEAPQEPQLADTPQEIKLSADLELAVGSGGALAGFGEAPTASVVQEIIQSTFDVGDLQKRPEPVSQTPPTYPAELRKARIEGVVTVVFLLNEDGRVEDARVENSSRPEFERPALEAIRKWRFRPGMKDGQAVRTYVRQPMRFRVPG